MPRRLTLALPLLLLACQSDKPEDQVKFAFSKAKTAIEEGDAGGAVDVLASDFKGPEDIDKASARFMLMGLIRQGKIGITVFRNDASLEGAEVAQEVELLITQKGGGILPTDAGRRHYLLRWVKREGEWRLSRMQEVR
jgi:hypothetical protein